VDEIADADIVLGIFGISEKAARVVPNKVYQAMSVGRCVITRDSPALREMFVPGRHLAVCPPGDAAALAETILALRDDPARAASLAEAGCALVRERFNTASVGQYAVSAIIRVAGSARHRRP
jgi:glycosyltransferase involved in cell wall biosynthesis